MRKNKVATKDEDIYTQNFAGYKTGSVDTITDKIEYDRSDIPEVTNEDDEKQDENKISEGSNKQYDKYVVPVKKGNLAVFDEKYQNVLENNNGNDEDVIKSIESEDPVVREKKDLLTEEKKEILNFYNKLRNKRKKYSSTGNNDAKISKKVQVQEETGTQRVQVNAGYENPRISCESGRNDCSGVLLKFSLTFYGTE